MNYRTRSLVSAAVGLSAMAGLGLFAYYGLHADHRNDERDQAFARLALDLDKDRVVRIELVNGAEQVVLLRSGVDERELPAWRMTAPFESETDGFAVNALLGLLDRLDVERRLPLAEIAALSEYGLDPPALTWTFALEDGQRVELLVGRKSPFSEQLYLRQAGADEIVLVKGHFAEALTKDAFAFGRKELVRVEPDRVQAVVLETPPRPADSGKPRVRIELVRRDGIWFLTAPFEDRADAAAVRKLLNTMRNLRARAFPKGEIPDKHYGLEPASWEVTLLSGPDRVRVVVRLGRGQLPSNRQRFFARATEPRGPLAELPSYLLSVVDKTPFELQAKAPVAFDTSLAARIKLSKEAELIVLERSRSADASDPNQKNPGKQGLDDWVLVSPVAGPARSYKVQALLAALVQLEATRFEGPADPANLKRTGLDRPKWTLVVDDDAGKKLARLQIGQASQAGTFVLGDARESICLVPTAGLSSVTADLADLGAGPSGDGGARGSAPPRKPSEMTSS